MNQQETEFDGEEAASWHPPVVDEPDKPEGEVATSLPEVATYVGLYRDRLNPDQLNRPGYLRQNQDQSLGWYATRIISRTDQGVETQVDEMIARIDSIKTFDALREQPEFAVIQAALAEIGVGPRDEQYEELAMDLFRSNAFQEAEAALPAEAVEVIRTPLSNLETAIIEWTARQMSSKKRFKSIDQATLRVAIREFMHQHRSVMIWISQYIPADQFQSLADLLSGDEPLTIKQLKKHDLEAAQDFATPLSVITKNQNKIREIAQRLQG